MIFYSSVWLLQNLVQWFPLEGGWSLLVFQVTSKVKVWLLVLPAYYIMTFLFIFFLLNLVQWLVIESRRSFWFSGHVVKGQRSNCLTLYKYCLTSVTGSYNVLCIHHIITSSALDFISPEQTDIFKSRFTVHVYVLRLEHRRLFYYYFFSSPVLIFFSSSELKSFDNLFFVWLYICRSINFSNFNFFTSSELLTWANLTQVIHFLCNKCDVHTWSILLFEYEYKLFMYWCLQSYWYMYMY